MTRLDARLTRLERHRGAPAERVELLGVTMTRAELDQLLRELVGTSTQARINTADDAP